MALVPASANSPATFIQTSLPVNENATTGSVLEASNVTFVIVGAPENFR